MAEPEAALPFLISEVNQSGQARSAWITPICQEPGMISHKKPNRQKPGHRPSQHSSAASPAVHDARAWLSGLKIDVQSMLSAVRRQHAEEIGGAIDRIKDTVSKLRCGVNELLPQLREARLDVSEKDFKSRQEYLEYIADWVDDVKESATDLCGQYLGERQESAVEADKARIELISDLTDWGDSLRKQVNELTCEMHEQRTRTAQDEAQKRREFVSRLREDVAELRRSFRKSNTPAPAPAKHRAAKAPAHTHWKPAHTPVSACETHAFHSTPGTTSATTTATTTAATTSTPSTSVVGSNLIRTLRERAIAAAGKSEQSGHRAGDPHSSPTPTPRARRASSAANTPTSGRRPSRG